MFDIMYCNIRETYAWSILQLLPFDDTMCVIEPCPYYQKCSTFLKFSQAANLISSDSMLFRPILTDMDVRCTCEQGFGGTISAESIAVLPYCRIAVLLYLCMTVRPVNQLEEILFIWQ